MKNIAVFIRYYLVKFNSCAFLHHLLLYRPVSWLSKVKVITTEFFFFSQIRPYMWTKPSLTVEIFFSIKKKQQQHKLKKSFF